MERLSLDALLAQALALIRELRENRARLRHTPKRKKVVPITSALRRHLAMPKPAPRPGHTFMGFYDAATDRYGWQFIPTNGNQRKKGAA